MIAGVCREHKKKILMLTLGCPKNEVDSDMLGGILKAHEFQIVDNSDKADIILINTCGFIESAKQESIDTILQAVELKKNKSDLKVYVWGCLSERYKKKLEQQIPEVDGFWGIEPFAEMGIFFIGSHYNYSPQSWKMRLISNYHHTAYIKIADGCNHKCTFCIIPAIKGKFRSRPIHDIVAEAEILVDKGVKELHLVAQDTTGYGMDLSPAVNLVTLLKELVSIKRLKWIRILYTYPDSVTDELIHIISSEPKICSYIDIPLQHISSRILKAMGRNADKKKIYNLIEKLRHDIPDVVLRTSFIVGFPGETEQDFQELLDFVEKVQFDRLGCFVFSSEQGTKAFEYNRQVDKTTAQRRQNQLMEIQYDISDKINKLYVNKTIQILIDGYDSDNEMYFGRSEGDALDIDQTVWVRGKAGTGNFYEIKIIDSSGYDLEGIRID